MLSFTYIPHLKRDNSTVGDNCLIWNNCTIGGANITDNSTNTGNTTSPTCSNSVNGCSDGTSGDLPDGDSYTTSYALSPSVAKILIPFLVFIFVVLGVAVFLGIRWFIKRNDKHKRDHDEEQRNTAATITKDDTNLILTPQMVSSDADQLSTTPELQTPTELHNDNLSAASENVIDQSSLANPLIPPSTEHSDTVMSDTAKSDITASVSSQTIDTNPLQSDRKGNKPRSLPPLTLPKISKSVASPISPMSAMSQMLLNSRVCTPPDNDLVQEPSLTSYNHELTSVPGTPDSVDDNDSLPTSPPVVQTIPSLRRPVHATDASLVRVLANARVYKQKKKLFDSQPLIQSTGSNVSE